LSSIVDTLKIIVGRRWPLLALLFVAELVSIVLISNLSFFPGEFNVYVQQYNNVSGILNTSASSQVGGIFLNNFRVAMIEIIPGLGLALFSFSIYETARIVQVIGIQQHTGAGALATLFFLPSTWLELPAYSIAATEGVYLLYAFYYGFRRGWGRLRREFRFLWVNVMLIGVVLIVAAVIEVTEIQIATIFQGTPNESLALLTWIPFFLILVGVAKFWRKAKRDGPMLQAQEEAANGALADKELSPVPMSQVPMNFCTKCGSKLPAGAAFCGNCGADVSG
jgi:uncharacterized membrane protein SpoIIM required for sporulation